jgi:hypothetical protein
VRPDDYLGVAVSSGRGCAPDYFVATADQAAAVALRGPQDRGVPAVLAKWILPMRLGTLYAIAVGLGEADAEVDEPVDVDRPDGPWLMVIRDEVTATIAAVADEDLASVGNAWAMTEEWQRDRAPASEVVSIFGELRDLARQADPPTRRMYLWMCL